MCAHPRFLLAVVAVLFAFTAIVTSLYPPDYLGYPYLWSLLALTASTTSALAAARPGRQTVLVAGTTAVVAAIIRSLAIAIEVSSDPKPQPLIWSFWLAATTWGALAILLHALWQHVIVPWASIRRMAE